MPAPAVIPAPRAYTKIAVVKTLVVHGRKCFDGSYHVIQFRRFLIKFIV